MTATTFGFCARHATNQSSINEGITGARHSKSEHHLAAPVGPCPDCGCPGWWLSRLRDRWRCGDCEPWPTRVLVVDIALVVIGDDGQLEAEVIPGFGLHRRLGEDSCHCDEPPIDVEFQRQAAGGGRRRGICKLHFERLERERRDLDA